MRVPETEMQNLRFRESNPDRRAEPTMLPVETGPNYRREFRGKALTDVPAVDDPRRVEQDEAPVAGLSHFSDEFQLKFGEIQQSNLSSTSTLEALLFR